MDSNNKRKRGFKRHMSILILIGLWLALVLACQRRIIFPRHVTTPMDRTPQTLPGLEKLWTSIPAGKVEAWYLPPTPGPRSERHPVVMFAHGNGELIDYLPEMLEPYRKMGIGVLLCEYRGYGRSAGSPAETRIVDDFQAFRSLIADRPEVDADRIFYHGRSLGGGVACSLAGRERPTALILESTFTRVSALAKRMLVPGFLIYDKFDNHTFLQSFDGPVLFMHGTNDTIVPFSHGQANLNVTKNGRMVSFECGHNDLPPDPRLYWHAIETFLIENDILRSKPTTAQE